ncbi:MAG: hypothetical protein A2293_13505 [Elusimicrobia bacterium RIFOXYB2_FULL_49_7]|nr:MAG: hypothetical protein A2293_13505 [Elusimicrobia bacterium RIFOXYB2_FULL_49_7]
MIKQPGYVIPVFIVFEKFIDGFSFVSIFIICFTFNNSAVDIIQLIKNQLKLFFRNRYFTVILFICRETKPRNEYYK